MKIKLDSDTFITLFKCVTVIVVILLFACLMWGAIQNATKTESVTGTVTVMREYIDITTDGTEWALVLDNNTTYKTRSVEHIILIDVGDTITIMYQPQRDNSIVSVTIITKGN